MKSIGFYIVSLVGKVIIDTGQIILYKIFVYLCVPVWVFPPKDYGNLRGIEEMRKYLYTLCFSLVFCVFMACCSFGAETDDPLPGLNIRVALPEGASAALKGNEYYIYLQEEDSIPYIMLRSYRYDDSAAFLDQFTAFMKEQYPDLEVTEEISEKEIGGKQCREISYSYQVSGYEVRDRRIVTAADGVVYVFTSKEIEELGLTAGSMLEDIVAGCEFISDSDAEGEGPAAGYLYCREDGMPEYWLDLSENLADNPVLHCYFPSEDPADRERCLVLDLSAAEVSEKGLGILRVYDLDYADYSDRFRELTLQFYLDGAVMTVQRDENTEADSEEDFLPDGSYLMVPTGVSPDSTKEQSFFCPAEGGPYQPEELGIWARFYCFRSSGIFPAEADITENAGGTFTIHLTGEEGADQASGTGISECYTVDSFGEGKDDQTGEKISLMR